MTYLIHESNMERLMKKLTTIQNKCAKYGCEFHFEELGEVFQDTKDETTGEVYTARYIEVEVSGIARIADWEFVATIEHADPMNIIRSFRPEYEIPARFYTSVSTAALADTARTLTSSATPRRVSSSRLARAA